MMPASKDWAIVMDARHIRILARPAPAGPWDEVERVDLPPLPPSRTLGTGRPGRGQTSARDGRRFAITPRRDLHEQMKAEVARQLAVRLEQAAGHQCERLILVAPPRMLGHLHQALGPRSRRCLSRTVPLDLVPLRSEELLRRLDAML